MSNTGVGREPIQIFEIEQPSCSNEYGVSPCTASGSDKCFNTRFTCQDPENYNQNDKIFWRFTQASSSRIIDTYEEGVDFVKTPAIPSLIKASTTPTEINPGGGSEDIGALGRRSSVKINLGDSKSDDSFADKYLDTRPYSPFDTGTFWGKFLARNPYYASQVCRIYEGYRGEDLSEMLQRTYIIDKIDGPTSKGAVSITAKDPLKLADDKRAQAPMTSDLALVAGIDSSQTTGITFVGLETDISDELGNTGTTRYIRLNDEIISYTGYSVASLQYTLTGALRAQLLTEADSHSLGESGQRAVRYEAMESWLIARDLILNYSTVPDSYIDLDAWNEEGNTWLTPYIFTGTIAEPTPVTDLVGELAQQSLFYIWWNERTQLIELRALRPATGALPQLNDDVNILENSFSLKTKPDERISRVAIYYNKRNPTGDADDIANYSNARITVNGEVESEFLYNEIRTTSIFSRWMVSAAQAVQIGTRQLAAFSDTPKYIQLSVDAKDRDLWTADIVEILTNQIQDQFGQPDSGLWQITSAQEIKHGDTVKYNLRQFTFQIDRAAFWTENNQVDYASANPAERLTGNAWWADNDGLMPGGDDGYKWS